MSVNRSAGASVYRYSGDTWTEFGRAGGSINAITVAPNGNIIVAGNFWTMGLVTLAYGVALWDGTSWHAIGAGLPPTELAVIYALAAAPNGDIIAGGIIPTVNGLATSNVARWNGSTWSPMGPGLSGSTGYFSPSQVRALLALPNGDIIAGGNFTAAGSSPVRTVARWNGSKWLALGDAHPGSHNVSCVLSLQRLPDGSVLAGGGRTLINGAFVSRWNGAAWTAIGEGLSSPTSNGVGSESRDVKCLMAMPDGHLFAGGGFTGSSAGSAAYIAQWTGEEWAPLVRGVEGTEFTSTIISSAIVRGGEVVVAGRFRGIKGTSASNIARLTTSGWAPVGEGFTGSLSQVISMPGGKLIVSGSFTTTASGTPVNHIATWDGVSWSALGSGVTGINGSFPVRRMLALANGDLIIGGDFLEAGGQAARRIAKWNGSAWSGLGTGRDNGAGPMLELPSGDLIVADDPDLYLLNAAISRWNGEQWLPLGSGMTAPNGASIRCIMALSSGDIVAAGRFSSAGGAAANSIARWTGAEWLPLGAGINGEVRRVIELPNHDLVVSGQFSSAGTVQTSNIARWDGQSWSALGPGLGGTYASFYGVHLLQLMPDGSLIAGGSFAAGGMEQADNLARWNGQQWTPLTPGLGGTIFTLTLLPSGELIATGQEAGLSGAANPYFGYLVRLGCQACYPNCDGSTSTPTLNAADFQCFLLKFVTWDPYANCDNSTAPPILNINDFQCFVNKFAVGCQ